jgi:hypothetical protein
VQPACLTPDDVIAQIGASRCLDLTSRTRSFGEVLAKTEKDPGRNGRPTTQRDMHLSPAATEDAIRLLDGRLVDLKVAHNVET